MSSDSESDCELYTKSIDRFKFKSKVQEILDVVEMATDKEMSKLVEEVESGVSPMDALIKVQMEQLPLSTLLKNDESAILQNKTTPKRKNYKKQTSVCVSASTRLPTRVTRASTRASTKASLAKAQASIEEYNVENIDSSGGNSCQDEERLSSFAQSPTKKRGRFSKTKRVRSNNLNNRLEKDLKEIQPANVLDTIVLDDDTDYRNTITKPIDFGKSYNFSFLGETNSDSDESSFCDKEPVKVTVEWHTDKGLSRKTFIVGKYEKFDSVYEELAKMEGVDADKVILMRQFTSIKPSDSPASLDMKFYGALTGFLSKTAIDYENTHLSDDDKVPEGTLKVKLQLETKEKVVFTVFKRSTMDTLYDMASKKLKCAKDGLKLYFDGEYMPPTVKFPSDLEDGDMFTAHIKK